MKFKLFFYCILIGCISTIDTYAQIQHLQTMKDGFLEDVRHVVVSPDDNFVYAGGKGFAIFQRDSLTGRLTQVMATDSIYPNAMGITNSGQYLMLLMGDYGIHIYERNLQTGMLTWKSKAPDVSHGYYSDIEFTNDDSPILGPMTNTQF